MMTWFEPLKRFFRLEASSGVILMLAAVAALLWVHSPWGASYDRLWHFQPVVGAGDTVFVRPLHFWINDGLMAFFFLLVGVEIRRELHDGALATFKLALLPVAAALGGVIVPALLYLTLNGDPALRQGWAVPTATDIAFALGVLALLGRRIPPALRVILLSIAIIDDIVAVLVIAFFYSSGIALEGVWVCLAGVALVLAMQKLGIRSLLAYVLPGIIVWSGLLQAGIHPALSGVILGLLTPVVAKGKLGGAPREIPSPAVRVQKALHPWVTYAIMPLFALANAGVTLDGLAFDWSTMGPLLGGIILGLVAGKPLGIFLTTALMVKMRWCELPRGVDLRGIFVIGCLGGIGFTMSIFIAALAFPDAGFLAVAKLAVLIASTLAACVGLAAGLKLTQLVGAARVSAR